MLPISRVYWPQPPISFDKGMVYRHPRTTLPYLGHSFYELDLPGVMMKIVSLTYSCMKYSSIHETSFDIG